MDLTVFEIDSFGRVKAVSPLFCTFGPLIGDKTLLAHCRAVNISILLPFYYILFKFEDSVDGVS